MIAITHDPGIWIAVCALCGVFVWAVYSVIESAMKNEEFRDDDQW